MSADRTTSTAAEFETLGSGAAVARTHPPARAGVAADPANLLVNAMTVDVEDYFQVSAMAPYIRRASWDVVECRVERNVQRLLQIFAEHGVKATFFTLAWVAARYPGLVREIVDAGHELASHGCEHRRASEQSASEFRRDLTESKAVLEDVGGQAVIGYRAPSFSIGQGNAWAFDELVQAGYRYSSSIYPVKHDHYGSPEAPRFIYEPRPGLMEIPLTTTRLLGRNLPAGGGGYFRLAPYVLSRWAIRRVNRLDRQSAIFYMHPWEIDPDQPRIAGTSPKTRFRHYVNLSRTESKLNRLLRDFRWGRLDQVYALSP